MPVAEDRSRAVLVVLRMEIECRKEQSCARAMRAVEWVVQLKSWNSVVALFPGPRPAFCHLQYGKAGRAWYVSSREHDLIDK